MLGIAGLVAEPAAVGLAAVVLWSVLCLLISIQQVVASLVGLRRPTSPVLGPPIPDDQLPRYTVLVPLYREGAVVADLVAALGRLDYPKHLLDVILLIEADDTETPRALEPIELEPHFEIVEVPAGKPQTKPRACNFGLERSRGELVVIFDAEDRPEPDQLRRAAAAFRQAPADVACFQAQLAFWNRTTNLLTRFCTAEFCAIFTMISPCLEHLRAPIPLGGTSNHLPVDLLKELGGWDPYNVAEDADLGIRLARAGYRTQLLASTTYEEANSRIGNWIRQQSRWIKGYMQTWLVHTRSPRRLHRELGLGATINFHLTMLCPVVPILLAPLGWIVTAIWVLHGLGLTGPVLPIWLLDFSAISFVVGNAVGLLLYAVTLRRNGLRGIVPYAVVFPLYQLVKCMAAAKATWQLITRPSYWEKTVHGLDLPGSPGEIAGA